MRLRQPEFLSMPRQIHNDRKAAILHAIYQRLLSHYGPQHWWPGDSPFEVCVGAVLTQNTNWQNVERAILKLRSAGKLSFPRLYRTPLAELKELIRPAGFFNVKARRLRNFLEFLHSAYRGDLDALARKPWPVARAELLYVNGIGNETADSILLYALNKPVFVIDAYTKRLLLRHGFRSEAASYAAMQELFMTCLPVDVALYNEYHALIVRLGKDCRGSAPVGPDYPLKDRQYFL
jgi:endonuclease-3 related protein